ncbi:hypothetical protein [Citrobacter sp. Cpo107]|uniref:hypothetical protein n=1 Tax=Citrobacter TaxID=544 RepID=UPI0025791F5D|nr:hypothetical protein [Citrobacter sp. Cpo107]MDM2807632.1 hypothetical protein [Citrobacter sp. Cpo107]
MNTNAKHNTDTPAKFNAPVVLATGRQRWSRKQNKFVLQSHYSKADHIACHDIDALWLALTNHDERLYDDTETGRADLKSRLPFFFAGGLANGGMPITGSGYNIPFAATKDPENAQYLRRNNSDIAPCSLITLDIDELPATLAARLTGSDGKPAAMDAYCGFVHSTASSTQDAPHLRVGVILSKSVSVAEKAAYCARFERQLMAEAGAVPADLPGRYIYDGQPVKCDASAYRDVQVNFMPSLNCHIATLHDGQQIDPEALQPLSDEVAARYANAGRKQRDVAYDVPANGFTGAAADLEAAAIELGFEPLNKPGLYALSDHPFKSDETESRTFDTSFALQVDQDVKKSRFQSERQTWRDHCAECVAAGKSSQYAAAIKLGFDHELAAQVWGGEFYAVANADEFEVLPPLTEPTAPETEPLIVDNFEGWRDVDLAKAPGLIGAIADDMNRLNYRPLPLASVTGALQCVALAAAISGAKTPHGGKITFSSMTLGVSGGGKDQAQSYAEDLAQRIMLRKDFDAARLVYNAPRSDKDVYQTLFEAAAVGYPVLALRVDEAQALLSGATNTNASEFTRGILPLLMQLITAKRFKFPGRFIREVYNESTAERAKLYARRKQASKAIKLLDDGKPADLTQAEAEDALRYVECRLAELKQRDELAATGIENPSILIMLSSTPAEFERFVNVAAIESGFLPRVCTSRNGNTRGQSVETGDFSDDWESFDEQHPDTARIIARMNALIGGTEFEDLSVVDVPEGGVMTRGGLMYDADARAMRKRIFEYFEHDDRLNAPVAGAMYCRAMAHIDTICAIAAVESKTVTVDVLRYALAYTLTSITDAIRIAMRNEEADPLDVIKGDIVAYLERKNGEASFAVVKRSVMANKTMQAVARAWAKVNKGDPFEHVVKSLVSVGRLSGGKGQALRLTKVKV